MIDLTGIRTNLKYEYSVHISGEFFTQAQNEKFKPGYYVFSSLEERKTFMLELIDYTLEIKQNDPTNTLDILHEYEEGYHVRLKHIVTFSIFYNELFYNFTSQFPITWSEDQILYLYLEDDGDLSCDCFKKKILKEIHNVDIDYDSLDSPKEFACGNELKYENIQIKQEQMTTNFITSYI